MTKLYNLQQNAIEMLQDRMDGMSGSEADREDLKSVAIYETIDRVIPATWEELAEIATESAKIRYADVGVHVNTISPSTCIQLAISSHLEGVLDTAWATYLHEILEKEEDNA